MKKRLTFFLSALLLCAVCFAQTKPAQDARVLLKEDPTRAGNLHHHYEPLSCVDTPAPEGYSPVYVSHYGRHGSRYLSNDKELKDIIPNLELMKDEGLLTEKGEQLLSDMNKLKELHEGMYGMLTQRGGREHREIAKRLYARVPSLFGQSDRDSLTCVSTPVPRCIQSMANFTISLKEEAPGLKLSYYTGEKYRDYLNSNTDDSRSIKEIKEVEEALLKSEFNPERLVRTYFKGLMKGNKVGKRSPEKFFYYLYKNASIYQCLDDPQTPDIFSIFTEDELYTLWRINNIRTYGGMCNSIESLGERNSRAAFIIEDIVEKADMALAKGSRVAGDLRFAHDSGIGPLVSFLALEGNEKPLHVEEANDYWYCFQNVCMGTNLQIIFYQNDKGDTLVKFIHNEQERRIPALKAVSGPYYNWKDVRKYCNKLVKEGKRQSL